MNIFFASQTIKLMTLLNTVIPTRDALWDTDVFLDFRTSLLCQSSPRTPPPLHRFPQQQRECFKRIYKNRALDILACCFRASSQVIFSFFTSTAIDIIHFYENFQKPIFTTKETFIFLKLVQICKKNTYLENSSTDNQMKIFPDGRVLRVRVSISTYSFPRS